MALTKLTSVGGSVITRLLNNLRNLIGLPYIFKSVSELKNSTLLLPAGKLIMTTYHSEATSGGGSKYICKTVAQAASDGDIIDELGGGFTLAGGMVAVLLDSGEVTPAQFGALRDIKDYSSNIQASWDYAAAKSVGATGVGNYYVSSTVTLNANFSSTEGMNINTTSDFASGIPLDIEELGRRVIIVTKINARIKSLLALNDGDIPMAVGLDYSKHQIKSENSGGVGFMINSLVRSFSITILNSRNTRGGRASGDAMGYGLLAYAPFTNTEINAITIDGGEFFGGNSVAIDIGDTLNLFNTSIPNGEFHGVGLRIVNQPTCDQGQIRIDKMLNSFIDVYTEKSTAVVIDADAALVLGGAFENSVRGIEIIGYASNWANIVECRSGVSGIDMHNTRGKSITTSALRLVSDQYSYSYRDNFSTGSFALGQEVHTGVRSGVTTNAWSGCTIDIHDLVGGVQSGNGEHIYPDKNVMSGGVSWRYANETSRYYKTPYTAACSVVSNKVTLTTPSQASKFNGGDAIKFSGTGGTLAYILSVDYVNGFLYISSYSGSGSGNIAQQSILPRIEYSSYQPPASVDYAAGSIVWNIFTVDTTTIFWVLRLGAWVSKS